MTVDNWGGAIGTEPVRTPGSGGGTTSPTTPTAPIGGGGSGSLPLPGGAGYWSGAGYGSIAIPLTGSRNMARLIVPPGGFAGFAQQTAATQAMFQRAGRKGGLRSARKRRRTKKKAVRAVGKRRTRRSTKRPARLVKGSAAAKRYMASIRRKRKRG